MPEFSRRINTASAVCCAIAAVLLVGAPVAFVLLVPRCMALLRDFNVQLPASTQMVHTAYRALTTPATAAPLFGALGLAVALFVAKEFTLKDVHIRLGINIAAIVVVLAFVAVFACGIWAAFQPKTVGFCRMERRASGRAPDAEEGICLTNRDASTLRRPCAAQSPACCSWARRWRLCSRCPVASRS